MTERFNENCVVRRRCWDKETEDTTREVGIDEEKREKETAEDEKCKIWVGN